MSKNWYWAGGFLALVFGGIAFGAKAGVDSGRAALLAERAAHGPDSHGGEKHGKAHGADMHASAKKVRAHHDDQAAGHDVHHGSKPGPTAKEAHQPKHHAKQAEPHAAEKPKDHHPAHAEKAQAEVHSPEKAVAHAEKGAEEPKAHAEMKPAEVHGPEEPKAHAKKASEEPVAHAEKAPAKKLGVLKLVRPQVGKGPVRLAPEVQLNPALPMFSRASKRDIAFAHGEIDSIEPVLTDSPEDEAAAEDIQPDAPKMDVKEGEEQESDDEETPSDKGAQLLPKSGFGEDEEVFASPSNHRVGDLFALVHTRI